MLLPPPSPDSRPNTDHDLRPDPVFLILRLVVGGPIGWLQDRLDAWQDARQQRRESAAAIATAKEIVSGSTLVSTISERETCDDLAA